MTLVIIRISYSYFTVWHQYDCGYSLCYCNSYSTWSGSMQIEVYTRENENTPSKVPHIRCL